MNKHYRLTEGRSFQRVRLSGKSWSHPILVLVAAPNNLDITRHGFAVGKRMGKAHTRNKLKRQIREAVRVRHSGIKTGFDFVWIARNNMNENTGFWAIDQAVENLLKRSRLQDSIPLELENRPKNGGVPG